MTRHKAMGPKGLPEPQDARGRVGRSGVGAGASGGSRGPLFAPSGAGGVVLVDPDRCPTLWRKCRDEYARRLAIRARWADYMVSRDPNELASLLGVAPRYELPEEKAQRAVDALVQKRAKEPAPAGVAIKPGSEDRVRELMLALGKAPDKKAAGKIRAELRSLGHRGGLRST